MICGKCQKNHATVHVTEVIHGVKKEAHLCEECARAAGVGVQFNFSITELLGGAPESGKASRAAPEPLQLRCPECGLTYTDFKAKARLGCANDYEVFRQGLIPLLEKIHSATQHVGKVPHTADTKVRKENELARLKRELDGLVKSEDYEKAAQARDRIRILEAELDRGV